MNDVIARYRMEVLPGKGEKTRKNQSGELTRLAKVFGDCLPDEVTTQHVYQYMDTRAQKSVSAARAETVLLHHVFVKAIRWGAASNNPAKGVEKPKPKSRKKRYVSDDEFLAVWKLASPQMRVAMDLALLTGLRTGDLLRLTRDSLTEKGLYVETSKTEKDLLILYSPALEKALSASKKLKPQVPGTYLIRTMRGNPYTTDGFKTNWQRLMRKAVKEGVPRFMFKDIRKKCATDKKNSDNLLAASQLLGHTSTTVTQKHYITDATVVTPLK